MAVVRMTPSLRSAPVAPSQGISSHKVFYNIRIYDPIDHQLIRVQTTYLLARGGVHFPPTALSCSGCWRGSGIGCIFCEKFSGWKLGSASG